MLIVAEPVNAGSSAFFTAVPKSTAGADDPPLSAFVKVICLTTDTVVREETQINTISGAIVSIKVTGEENQMIDPTNNTKEKRSVLLRVTFGVGDDFTDHVDFSVVRIDLPPDV